MKGLFREKMEYLTSRFNTNEGIFEYLLSSFIWGYIIINYADSLFSWINGFLPPNLGALQSYVAYLLFGLLLLPLGILITYLLTKTYHILFKSNGKIIK